MATCSDCSTLAHPRSDAPPMSVTVRDATENDARAIAEVHVASWRWAYRDQLPSNELEKLSVDDREAMWTAWFLSDERRAAVLVTCLDDGRVVGFANAGPSRDEDAPSSTGELRAIYVLQEVQGTGVGSQLLEGSFERMLMDGFERATLWVLETNDLGRRFYERKGWSWDGTVSDHQFECANLPIVRYALDLAG
jgi:GNAT superfamily N-acetyltransferase